MQPPALCQWPTGSEQCCCAWSVPFLHSAPSSGADVEGEEPEDAQRSQWPPAQGSHHAAAEHFQAERSAVLRRKGAGAEKEAPWWKQLKESSSE